MLIAAHISVWMDKVAAFLAHMTRLNMSQHTIKSYRADLESFLRWLTNKGLAFGDVGHSHLEEYHNSLIARGYAAATICRALNCIRSFFNFIFRQPDLQYRDNPAILIRAPKVPRRIPQFLTENQVFAMMLACSTSRNRAILELFYASAIRVSELVAANVNDINTEAGHLMVTKGKGAKARMVPVASSACKWVDRWLDDRAAMLIATRSMETALFIGRTGKRMTIRHVSRTIRQIGRAAGIQQDIGPHILRHSCATHMMDHGADIADVQELLGHANINTTTIYAHTSLARLRKAYSATHPSALREIPLSESRKTLFSGS